MAEFTTGYMDIALFNLSMVIADAVSALEEEAVEFDTLVGTGFSGGVVVPALALAMGKKFLLVRKPNDDSHHSGDLIGSISGRWLFVDDFISGGGTKRRVMEAVASHDWGNDYTYAGDYLYRSGGFRPEHPDSNPDLGVKPEPEPEYAFEEADGDGYICPCGCNLALPPVLP